MIRHIFTTCVLVFSFYAFTQPPGSKAKIFFIKRAGTQPLQVGKPMQTGLFICDSSEKRSHPVGWKNIIATHFTVSSDKKTWYLSAGNGVLRSIDGGKTFKIITDWRMTEVMFTWVNPQNPKTLISCTATGLFRSHDEGKTWKEINKGLARPGEKYAGQLYTAKGDTATLYICTAEGIFTSATNGDTWNLVGFKGKETACIDIAGGTKEQMLAIAGKNVFVSFNKGLKWELCYAGKNRLCGMNRTPADPSRVYVYGIGTGLIFSPDSGKNWNLLSNELTGKTVFCLSFSNDGKSLYAGTDEGLWISSNNGKSFARHTEWDGRITFVCSEE